jgi:hypothetical protein
MGAPQKIGLDYFPHDCDASQDEKIAALEGLHGLEGYAIYFKLLERIYRQGGKLKFEEGFSEAETLRILAKGFGIVEAKIREIIQTSIRVGLFDKLEWEQKKVLTSTGILKRCAQVFEKRKVDRSRLSDTTTPRELCDNNTTITPIVKNSKEILPEFFSLARVFKENILKNSQEARINENQVKKWADTFRLMVERDKRTVESIKEMVAWVFSDASRGSNGFWWGKVIRSADTLRDRWNEGKLSGAKMPPQKPSPPKMSADEEEFQKLRMSLIQRGSENT